MYVFDLLLEIVIYNKSFAIWNIVNLNPNKAGLFEGIFFRVFLEKFFISSERLEEFQ